MSIVAVIPARGGSKGIFRKNIRLLAGKPLIAWSIEQALSSKLISDVYVSTDSREIADVALAYGAKVPFLRPSEISGDTASTESALLHFCDYAVSSGMEISALLLLQCTSPVRNTGVLDNAINFYLSGNYDSLLSVSESHRFFWENTALPRASYDHRNRPRRQDIQDSDRRFLETGSFYLSKFDNFIREKNRLFGKIGMFVTADEESYEIDTENDFVVCEALVKSILGK